MTSEERERILASLRKTAAKVREWPLWQRGVLGTPQWMLDEHQEGKEAERETRKSE